MHNSCNSFFLISIGLFFLVFFLKMLTRREKALFKIFLVVIFLRLILLFFMQADLNSFYNPDVVHSRFFNDGEAYSGNALIISDTLRGRITEESFFYTTPGAALVSGEVLDEARKGRIIKPQAYEVGYGTYLYSLIYAAYGYAPAFLNFMNIAINMFTALFIFLIARYNFNRATAYISTVLFLFWPTVFYYSCTKLKDPLLVFLCYLLLFLWLNAGNRKIALLLIPLVIFSMELVRQYYGLLFLAVVGLFICVKIIAHSRASCISVVSVLVFIAALFHRRIYSLFVLFLETCASKHVGCLVTGGIVYSLFGNNPGFMDYSLLEWLRYIAAGWYHLTCEPLFSSARSLSTLLFYPFKIIFILLFIFAVLGAVMALRQPKPDKINNFLLLFFFLFFGMMFATVEANTGTMLRHRDLIAPIVFIYGGYFISGFIPKKQISVTFNADREKSP